MPDGNLEIGTLVPTEQINPHSLEIDQLPTEAVLRIINQEDRQVPLAVEQAIPQIAQVVDRVVAAFRKGGRLFYLGAGTSGRLGVLDASECPPTYSTPPDLVQGIIAGGDVALRHAVEGAEDSAEQGRQAIMDAGVTAKDVVIGISASGGARYVVTAVEYAKSLGAFTGAITCHSGGALAQAADVAMVVAVGPEVITGSTRMKAGTAQKLVLNMITTSAMVQWGKTYRNLMVDLTPTNEKLHDRARRLVTFLAKSTPQAAQQALEQAHGQVKPAVVMLSLGVDYPTALALLTNHHGKLRAVLEQES